MQGVGPRQAPLSLVGLAVMGRCTLAALIFLTKEALGCRREDECVRTSWYETVLLKLDRRTGDALLASSAGRSSMFEAFSSVGYS